MASVWQCLYTRHKTQKRKRWLDGLLKVFPRNNKVLFRLPREARWLSR